MKGRREGEEDKEEEEEEEEGVSKKLYDGLKWKREEGKDEEWRYYAFMATKAQTKVESGGKADKKRQ